MVTINRKQHSFTIRVMGQIPSGGKGEMISSENAIQVGVMLT
jgi:hypothetical protein